MIVTENDTNDILVDRCSQLQDDINKIVAAAKQKQINITKVVYVDEDGNDAVTNIYGFRYHIYKISENLDNLAQKYLGNASYGTLLAYLNGVKNEYEIPVGSKIKIPILNETNIDLTNQIYAEPEKQENYGIDIYINDDGNFMSENGDFKKISNQDNLFQNINNRLSSIINKRIRLVSYGIRATIGDPIAVRSYLISSIKQTVLADPRVQSIESLSFQGKGDTIEIKISLIDINNNVIIYRGIQ